MMIECQSEVENEELYERIFGSKPKKEMREDCMPLLVFPEVEIKRI